MNRLSTDINNISSLFDSGMMYILINKLPNRYGNMLDKNGENLSGGERQKIALIRAIVKDAPIIIMDEPTANIDKQYSEFIYNDFINQFSEKTFIIITHKMEYIAGMDMVYEIKNYTISEV